jgi:hypothetical protein
VVFCVRGLGVWLLLPLLGGGFFRTALWVMVQHAVLV